jgi:hypothetical protein
MDKPITDAALGKLVAQMCEQHGGVRISRAEGNGGAVLTITARSAEPVQCLVKSGKS